MATQICVAIIDRQSELAIPFGHKPVRFRMKQTLNRNQIIALTSLAFVGVSLAFSFLVIKDFSSPLSGKHVDVNHWEYIGFYFKTNLSFDPFPKLNLVNNQVFYPYGTNSVFQSWGLEREFFYTILYSFWGLGPWMQIYYFLTVLVTAIGTFILLFRDYGFARSIGAGFLVSFGNFYAINKYPYHLCYAVIHWTTLSFIADFLIVKRVALKQQVSLKLTLVRACLLILSLSQELGYIAGFALMSFTVSSVFIAVLLSYRNFRGEQGLIKSFQGTVETYKSEFFTYPRTSLFLLSLSIIASYIYLPLVFQIAREAKSFKLSGVKEMVWWASPYRLLIPFFPGLNPSLHFEKLFQDSPEGLGAASPGWFLLILATVGLWQTRKHIIIFLPLSIVFLLCIFYHPENIPTFKRWFLPIIGIVILWLVRKRGTIFLPLLFIVVSLLLYKEVYFPTLKIFPWFTFNRVAGRSTVIYPVILCLFALEINLKNLRLLNKKLVLTFLICLACTEFYTAYSFKLYYQPYSFDKNFFNYMNYVKEQQGEAVLDWPFCVTGGNKVGAEKLCPYFDINSGIYTMRRFHQKKVIGQYFGRLHPSQVEPYLQAGWDKLFFPNSQNFRKATHQKRCFRPNEWSFFTEFYRLNDFAGINLYIDLLPEDCVSEFYARFGTPAVETVVPQAGRVQFIPKSPELRSQVNSVMGATVKFKP